MKCKLSDIALILMGSSPSSVFYNKEKEGTPFLQGNRTFGYKFPYYDTYTTYPGVIAKSGDIIMSVRAPAGDINQVLTDVCIGRGLCALRMKKCNQDFLFYLLKYYSKQLIRKETGTVFGSISKKDISNLEIEIPENTSDLQKTVIVLSNIDKKIEINSLINNNLNGIDIIKHCIFSRPKMEIA